MASPLKSPHPGSEYGIAQKKIESGSLEETEYEHEHEKHFHTPRSLACRNLSLGTYHHCLLARSNLNCKRLYWYLSSTTSLNKWFYQSISQPVDQSINQPVIQSIDNG